MGQVVLSFLTKKTLVFTLFQDLHFLKSVYPCCMRVIAGSCARPSGTWDLLRYGNFIRLGALRHQIRTGDEPQADSGFQRKKHTKMATWTNQNSHDKSWFTKMLDTFCNLHHWKTKMKCTGLFRYFSGTLWCTLGVTKTVPNPVHERHFWIWINKNGNGARKPEWHQVHAPWYMASSDSEFSCVLMLREAKDAT